MIKELLFRGFLQDIVTSFSGISAAILRCLFNGLNQLLAQVSI